MGAWQALFATLAGCYSRAAGVVAGIQGGDEGGGESCEAEGGRGRGSGGLSHSKMHCREAQMDQWAVVCCDAKLVLPHTCIHKDARKLKAQSVCMHYATPSIRCFEP